MSNNNQELNNFLRALTEKNYAEANKYLRAVLDRKLVDRIKSTQDK